MIWFFAFTAIGIAIFAFFLTLRRFFALPLLQLFGGGAILGLCGLLAARAR
ncbi:MAG: hypothetical protein GX569_13195 [Candidatus Riflebacteria bacterium]|nr:hypothetical protein [Candidatus Riflebacteria bacterium]